MSDKEENPEKKPYADKDSIPPGRLSPEEYAKAKKEKLKRDSENYVKANNLRADFAYWATATSWTCTEMIFLVNGVDPEKGLKNDIYKTALEYHHDPFVTIEKQLKLTKRAQNDGVLAMRNAPISSCAWCQKMEIPVPFELLSLCVDSSKHKLAHDTELEEARKAAEEKLEATMKTGSAKEVLKALKDKEPGSILLENRLRLVGTLVETLTDAEREKKHFSSEGELINYLNKRYEGIGSDTTLKTAFADAKKLIVKKDPK